MTTPLHWGTEFLVNTTTAGNQLAPSITALPNGTFVAVWSDSSATGDDPTFFAVRGQLFSADGTKLGPEFVANTTTDGNQHTPTITALSDGRFAVAWQDSSGSSDDPSGTAVRGQLFSVSGGAVKKDGQEFLVNTTTAGGQIAPAITALQDGRFVVTWTDESLSGDDPSDSAVRGQVFSADGDKFGNEFLVNTITADGQANPTITALPNGNFIVAWSDSSQSPDDPFNVAVRAQVLNAEGLKIGPEFRVNTSINDTQATPTITALPDGRFAVAWIDFSATGGDTSQFAIRGQVFNGDGSKASAEFLVNTTTAGNQSDPAIAALADGRFVVTWTDASASGGDTSSASIRGQVFNGDGSKAGSEFLVNTTTDSSQSGATITALPDGRFVVAWGDGSRTGDDTSQGAIRGQIFDPRTAAVTLNGTLGDDDYVGSIFADTLKGRSGKDKIAGEAGDDVIDGGADDDRIGGGYGNDILHGGSGNDAMTGDGGSDDLLGDAGDDTLNGGAGADWHEGGTGDDTYIVDNALDRVVESIGGGMDTVLAATSFALSRSAEIEILRASDAAATTAMELTGSDTGNRITGNAGANILKGEGGADTLAGGGGADALIGGTGGDTYVVDSQDDTVIETSRIPGEIDTVQSLVSFTLGDNVENLVLLGSGDIAGTGNSLSNRLTGNAGANALNGEGGADTLIGGGGPDTLSGGAGADTYVVGAGDVISETSIGAIEIDMVEASVSWALGANLEHLTLTGTDSIDGAGNTFNNILTGNNAANRLDGGAGADILNGGSGTDRLTGGAGQDQLSGGADSDTFVFTKRTSGVTSKSVDTVLDWSVADQIDMTIKGSKRNYLEGSTKAKSIATALKAAEKLDAEDKATYVYLYNKKAKTGYLLADLDGNDRFETGVVLKGASAASHFSYGDII